MRKYYRRKKRIAKKKTYKSVAKVARNVVKSMAEKKYHDFNLDHNAGSGGQVFPLMALISRGTGQDNRVGDSVTLLSMYIQTTVLMSSNVGDTKYRFLIVRSKGTNTNPTVLNIFNPHVSTLLVNSPVETDKYTILYDKVYPLETNNKYRNINFKLKFNVPVQYNDSIASPAKEYFLVSISDAVVNTPIIRGNVRIKYLDI